MSKSIKLKNNNYLDSSSIVHNKETLKKILNKNTYTISDTPEKAYGINQYTVSKIGNLVIINIDTIYINSVTKDIWVTIGKISSEVAPKETVNSICVICNGDTGSIITYGKLIINTDGTLKIKIQSSSTTLCSINGNIIYFI